MTSLLQEIISAYTLLDPSQLSTIASNQVCNILGLLQYVVSYNKTCPLFMDSIYTTPGKKTSFDLYQHISPSLSTLSSTPPPSPVRSNTCD